MRTIDFTPLFRHSVGFDRLERMLDSAMRLDDGNSYPPYNIEQVGEDKYRISMAVAGFGENDLDVTINDGTLIVTGKHEGDKDEDVVYIHRGIAGRATVARVCMRHAPARGCSKQPNRISTDVFMLAGNSWTRNPGAPPSRPPPRTPTAAPRGPARLRGPPGGPAPPNCK